MERGFALQYNSKVEKANLIYAKVKHYTLTLFFYLVGTMSTILTESDMMGDTKGPPAKKARSGELETPTVDAGNILCNLRDALYHYYF